MPYQSSTALSWVESMPPEAALALNNLAQGQMAEAVLVPLVNQLGLMQQQMFDQFQQAMAMMVQMFGTMHRDQMEAVRAELNQLRELTEEFHALKKELAIRSESQVGPVARALSNALPIDRSVGEGTGVASTSSAVAAADLADRVHAREAGPAPTAFAGFAPSEARKQQPHLEPIVSPRPLPAASPVSAAPEPLADPSARTAAKPNPERRAPSSDRDTVIWLHERIAALQHERESRWQKILKLLPGMS